MIGMYDCIEYTFSLFSDFCTNSEIQLYVVSVYRYILNRDHVIFRVSKSFDEFPDIKKIIHSVIII